MFLYSERSVSFKSEEYHSFPRQRWENDSFKRIPAGQNQSRRLVHGAVSTPGEALRFHDLAEYAPNRKFRGSTLYAADLLVIPRDWKCPMVGKLNALIGDCITNNQQKVESAHSCGLATKTSATEMPGETRKARAAGINPVMLEMLRKRWFAT